MTTPIRNGVVVKLAEYGDCRQTDLYLPEGVNGLYVFRTTAQPFHDSGPHIIVHRIEHWFDEHRDYGVLIASSTQVEITETGNRHIFTEGEAHA
jgi:hypothetical protein